MVPSLSTPSQQAFLGESLEEPQPHSCLFHTIKKDEELCTCSECFEKAEKEFTESIARQSEDDSTLASSRQIQLIKGKSLEKRYLSELNGWQRAWQQANPTKQANPTVKDVMPSGDSDGPHVAESGSRSVGRQANAFLVNVDSQQMRTPHNLSYVTPENMSNILLLNLMNYQEELFKEELFKINRTLLITNNYCNMQKELRKEFHDQGMPMRLCRELETINQKKIKGVDDSLPRPRSVKTPSAVTMTSQENQRWGLPSVDTVMSLWDEMENQKKKQRTS